jgi:hypothetical protein
MQACPNKNSKEWKMLVSQTGEDLANMAFVSNGYSIPNVVPISEIKKDIGFKSKVENYAGIAHRLKLYNAKNGTSHYFTKKIIYGNTWELELHYNYLPVNAEKQRQDMAEKIEVFKAPINKEAFEELYPKIEYTPSPSEQAAGRFNEEGDFLPPDDTISYLMPDAYVQVRAVEQKRKEKIDSEIIKNRQKLQFTDDPTEYRKIIANIESLIRKQDKADQRLAVANKITAYEEVLKYADAQLDEVARLLEKDNLSFESIYYSQRVIDLWKSAGDFSTAANMHIILDEDEFNTPEIRNEFRLRAAKAQDLESNITEVKEDYIADFVREYTSKKLSKEEIFKLISDSSKIKSLTLNLGRHNDAMLQAIFSAVERANVMAQQEASEIWKNMDELGEKVRKKTGNNYNIFKQLTEDDKETGRLVDRFTSEFYENRNKFIQDAFHYRDESGELKKNPTSVKQYFDWINKNTITFDVRSLVPDSNLEGGSMPEKFVFSKDMSEEDKSKHIKEIKSALGEKGYESYLEIQKKKIEDFKVKREAIYESIQLDDNLSKEEKESLFKEWLKEFSPYFNLEMIDNPSLRKKGQNSFYSPKGIREYTIQIPKKTVDGKLTEWYDKNFQKIEADEDLLAFHTYMKETLNTLKYTLPAKYQGLLKVGVIPTIKKSLVDEFSEKGMMMGVLPFWDKMIELQTTTDLGTNISSDVNPLTGVIEKDINIQFIDDIDAKVRDLVKTMVIRYEQENNKPPTFKELQEFKKEARNILSKQKSWDLVKIMKAYSLMALAHKHKSFIEPQIKMAEQVFKERSEVVTNKAGQPKYKDGKVVTQEGLQNMKSALDFFLDSRYYNIGGRKIEGVSKQKLYTSEEKKRKKELEELISNEVDEDKLKILQDQLDQLGGYRTGSGVGDTLLKWMNLKGLGWNLPSAFSNVGFGTISNIIQASDGREYSMKELRKAYLLTVNSIGRNLSFNSWEGVNQNALKIRNLMDKWDLLKTSNVELYDTSQKSSLNKLKRLGPFTLQERTEYLNQAPVMIATMMKFKAKNEKGEEVDLWDAYDHEGNLKSGYTSDVDEIRMIQKIKRIIEMNHGDYNNPLQVKATFAGRALSQFRTWMFEGFANRFEAEKVDHALSYGMDEPYIRKGRYKSYTKGQLTTTGAVLGSIFLPGVGTIAGAGIGRLTHYLGGNFFGMQTEENTWSDILFTLKQLARKLAFKSTQFDDRFNKTDAANIRKNMTELYVLVTLAGIAILLKAISDDDEEDENKFIANFLLNQTTRLQTDISFYTNPLEFEKLTKTAIPMAQLLEDVNTWRKDVQSFFDDKKDENFESGPFKGDSKFLVHSGEMLPGTAQLIRLYRLGSKVLE